MSHYELVRKKFRFRIPKYHQDLCIFKIGLMDGVNIDEDKSVDVVFSKCHVDTSKKSIPKVVVVRYLRIHLNE